MKRLFEFGNFIARKGGDNWAVYRNNLVVAFIYDDEDNATLRFCEGESFTTSDLTSLQRLAVNISTQSYKAKKHLL